MLNIARDPKNAAVLGLSVLRLGLFAAMLVAAGLVLAGGFAARRQGITFESVLRLRETRPVVWHVLALGLCGLFAWGWLSLFSSSYLYGRWMYVFERLRPLGVALGLSSLQVTLVGLALTGRLRGTRAKFTALRPLWVATGVALAAILALASFIAVTKIGLVPDVTFWNMPGMPLSGVQYAGLLALLAVGIFVIPLHARAWAFLRSRKVDVLLFLAIYLAALVIWGGTPLLKHAFSLQPTPPTFQPYPTSDARVHDSGAIAILKGYGILFKGYTDKPLYMVFLALLHQIGGYDYNRITLLQVAFLALIPALLYLLGRAFHSRTLGVFVALAILFRQRNAIALAHVFDSGNPKLFTTEVPTLLGLILATLLVFLWLRSPQPRLWMALLAGGALGAVSLVRANPMLLVPAVGLLSLLALIQVRGRPQAFSRSLGRWASHAAVFVLGFTLLLGPWAVTGVNPEGKPWLILKFLDVINVRYSLPSGLETLPGGTLAGGPGLAAGSALTGAAYAPQPASLPKLPKLPEFIAMHTLHNVVGSVIALPDSLVYEDLAHLSQRSYWHYQNEWQGELSGSQAIFVALNLLLIALGLGYSWATFGWAGLAPLLVFGVYALSLGFARNSGSRYLVPMDWVAYFYFGLGLVLGLTFLRGLLGGAPLRIDPFKQRVETRPILAPWKGLALSLLALAALASLIPVANVLMVNDRTDQTNRAWAAQAVKAVPVQQLADRQLVTGEVFYPYNTPDGDFSFGILNKDGLKTFTIPGSWLAEELSTGDRALAGIQVVNGSPQVQFLYAGNATTPELLWIAQP